MSVVRNGFALIGPLLFAACAVHRESQFEAWTHQPTPSSWTIATPWKLIILDNKANVVVSMTLQFTEEKANSCVAGDWKRVRVSDFRSTDENFFPGNEPLSYELTGSALVIGRNELCDAYLTLMGPITTQSISGEYKAAGLSYEKLLGHFYAVPLR